MSWSVSTGIVNKSEVDSFIDALGDPYIAERPASWDQLKAAKDAAKLLLKSIPGPFVAVSLSGHANGVGWQKAQGCSNDEIHITVMQRCVEDLPKQRTPEASNED
jgi:hypothetical protein